MRVVIDGVRHHKCDWCRNDFTITGEKHLTLQLGERSGLASQESGLPGWRITVPFRPQQLHFCFKPDDVLEMSPCFGAWLKVIMAERPKEYVL